MTLSLFCTWLDCGESNLFWSFVIVAALAIVGAGMRRR